MVVVEIGQQASLGAERRSDLTATLNTGHSEPPPEASGKGPRPMLGADIPRRCMDKHIVVDRDDSIVMVVTTLTELTVAVVEATAAQVDQRECRSANSNSGIKIEETSNIHSNDDSVVSRERILSTSE